MNEADYPHREHPPGYDLTSAWPRVGDRSRRAEDRYLFLEALLSAREHLYISWCGRDIRSNEALPPSVVVADLIDYIDRAFAADSGESVAQTLLTEHSLQPFSTDNFSPACPEQRSWSPLWYRVAEGQSPDQADSQMPAPELPDELSLEALAQGLIDPAAMFLLQRFRVRLSGRELQLEDEEPLRLSSLERWQLRDECATQILHGDAGLELAERWWLEGRVPPGPAGAASLHEQVAVAQDFAARIRAQWPVAADTLTVSEQFDQLRIDASLPDHSVDGLLFWSASKLMQAKFSGKAPWQSQQIDAKKIMLPWLRHLLLNTQALPEAARVSRGWYEDLAITFLPLEPVQAREALDKLVGFYLQGLRQPLPLLPNCGWAFLNDVDVDAMFDAEIARSAAAARLLHEAPSQKQLKPYAEALWSLLRQHGEATPYD